MEKHHIRNSSTLKWRKNLQSYVMLHIFIVVFEGLPSHWTIYPASRNWQGKRVPDVITVFSKREFRGTLSKLSENLLSVQALC